MPGQRLVILQGFMDESWDSDGVGGEGIFVLAGYVSTVEKWAAFSKEWKQRLRWGTVQSDGSRQFKMSEMASQNRWDDLPFFYSVIMEYAELSISCIVDMKELNRAIDDIKAGIGDGVNELPFDIEEIKNFWRNPYYFTFRLLMDGFHIWRAQNQELFPGDSPVQFVFDNNSQKQVIRKVWDDYIATRSDSIRPTYGAEPRFEDDREFLPLQAADLRAWWVRKWATELGMNNIGAGVFPFIVPEKKVKSLTIHINNDGIFETVMNSVAKTVMARIEGGAQIAPIIPKSFYWPRKPL